MNDCKNGSAIRFVSGLAFTLMMCLASGCGDKIKLPSQDSTPPTYKWVVLVKDFKSDPIEYTTSGQTLQLGKRYLYNVSFIVTDLDGGVKHMTWHGGGKTACPESNRIDIASVTPPINGSLDLHPDPDGNVETQVVLAAPIDATCRRLGGDVFPQSIDPAGGTITLSAEGNNYFGEAVTSTLTIVSDP